MEIIIAFIVLLVLLLFGIPIPFAFFASTITIVVFGGYDLAFLIPYGYSKAGSFTLLAVPLFILAGAIMEKGSIGEKLVDMVEVLVGRVKGGLGAVGVVSCALFGAISGSGAATLSCIGSILFPRMAAAGYPRAHSAALLSNACVLGLLIPPSLNQILYAFVGGQSVLSCFLATVAPGVMLVILLSACNFFLLRKNQDIKITERYDAKTTTKLFAKRTVSAVPALLCPLIILGGIYSGAMTPTEAAAISVVYAFPVGFFIYRTLKVRDLKGVMLNSGTTAGVILTMLLSVMMLSRLYVMENVPSMILNFLTNISENPAVIMIFINIFIVIIGMIMDDTSAILLTTPILLPVVLAIGVDPVQFSAILGVNIGMGCVTPPCAPFLYLGARLGNAPINPMIRDTMFYIAFAWLPTLIVTTYVPGFALWLPRLLLG
jgi:tripartite ATP-independent transporter DctM subunit